MEIENASKVIVFFVLDHSLPEEGGNTTSIIAVAAIGILAVFNIVVAVILYNNCKSDECKYW